jgi:hypothetical protein
MTTPASTVERFSHMLPLRCESGANDVTADREEPPPRIVRMHHQLRIVTDEPTTRIELLPKNMRVLPAAARASTTRNDSQ